MEAAQEDLTADMDELQGKQKVKSLNDSAILISNFLSYFHFQEISEHLNSVSTQVQRFVWMLHLYWMQ